MLKKLLAIFLFISLKAFSQNFPLKISEVKISNRNWCQDKVKVADEQPVDCDFGNQFDKLYPVYVENFDYKEELPNNWAFTFGHTNDDEVDHSNNGNTWFGTSSQAYTNNLTVTNGIAKLIWKQEFKSQMIAFPNAAPKDYRFTGSILNSLLKIRQGITTAKIKLPENPNFWPAYWLFGTDQNREEIDIFEFYDDVSHIFNSCDVYHQMKMTLHNIADNLHKCDRNRKFPVAANFFASFHDYQCTFTDFKVHIFQDDPIPKGVATKFYDGTVPNTFCYTSGFGGIPNITYNCSDINNLDPCEIKIYGNCVLQKKINKDLAFPSPSSKPMNVLISNSINQSTDFDFENQLNSSWGNFSQTDREIAVDQVVIWQPIQCNALRIVYSESDFKNQSGQTNFLSGSKITLNSGCPACVYTSDPPLPSNNYQEFPTHVLATEEIAILPDVEFREGTYLRAEIILCIGVSVQQKPGANNPNTVSYHEISDEEIRALQQKEIDSLMKANPHLLDSLTSYNLVTPKRISSTDNGSIVLYPNPTSDLVNIDMVEEDYSDILYLELINNLGQKIKLEKQKQINMSQYASGMYQLKFVFSTGYIVVKSISKQ